MPDCNLKCKKQIRITRAIVVERTNTAPGINKLHQQQNNSQMFKGSCVCRVELLCLLLHILEGRTILLTCRKYKNEDDNYYNNFHLDKNVTYNEQHYANNSTLTSKKKKKKIWRGDSLWSHNN